MAKRRRVNRDQVVRARHLRREMSVVERLFWKISRGGRLGFDFRRQHPVGLYTLDFYCHEARLAIEFDGEQHDPVRDSVRDACMRELGIETLRISNLSVFLLDEAEFPMQWIEEIVSACEARTGRQVPR